MVVRSESKKIHRREFLYYMWGAGAGLLGIGVCGAATWFAMPHPEIGKDLFPINPNQLLMRNPLLIPEGGFWLCNTRNGVIVFSRDCPHPRQPRLFKWVPTNDRFECPACGSKFQLDGAYIEGPAPRSLDHYPFYVRTHSDTKYSEDGSPISIEGATEIVVDVREKIKGAGS